MKWYQWTESWEISWTPTTHYIFMALPLVLLALIFLLRKPLQRISPKSKGRILTMMGLIVIGWELWFDVNTIMSDSKMMGTSDAMWETFKGGFALCRLNMYLMGSMLLFRRTEMLKWILATAVFGGYSTLVDHYDGSPMASAHSLVTHAVMLSTFIPFALAMKPSNFTLRNLFHSYLLNYFIVGTLLVTNHMWHAHAGELTAAALKNNMIAGWAYDIWQPLTLIVWVGIITLFVALVFILHRVIYWASTPANRNTGFRKSFSNEKEIDKKEWFGFKWWGTNSVIDRKFTSNKEKQH